MHFIYYYKYFEGLLQFSYINTLKKYYRFYSV